MNVRQKKYLKQLKGEITPTVPLSKRDCAKMLKDTIALLSLEDKHVEEYAYSPPDENEDGSRTITFPVSCSRCDMYTGASAEKRSISYKPGENTGCGLKKWLSTIDSDGEEEYFWDEYIDGNFSCGCYRLKENKRSLNEFLQHGGEINIKCFDDDSLQITTSEGKEYRFIPEPKGKDANLNRFCLNELANNNLKFTPAYLKGGCLDDNNINRIATLMGLGSDLESGRKNKLTKTQNRDAIEEYAEYIARAARNTNTGEKIAQKYDITLANLKKRSSRANKKK